MHDQSNIIFVNAYPIVASGSAMILQQFFHYIENHDLSQYRFIVFMHPDCKITTSAANVQLETVHLHPLLRKLSYWQFFGLKRWAKQHGITPIATISLVSTNVRFNESIPNLLYFHNPIAIYREYKWSPFQSKERELFLYRNFYNKLIKFSLYKSTHVFTQLECIKHRFCNTFSHPTELVNVIRPDFTNPSVETITPQPLEKNYINLIYPATAFKYKNHTVLYDAIRLLKKQNINIKLYLTCKSSDFSDIEDIADCLQFLGYIDYATLLSYYTACDALVFPSYIESFGMPLLEASALNSHIIAANTDFAHELLNDYTKAVFCDYNNPNQWADAIKNLQISQSSAYSKSQVTSSNDWNCFFNLLISNINHE